MSLTFHSESGSSFVPVALELIERFCGIRLECVDGLQRCERVAVYHGRDSSYPCELWIPLVNGYDEADIPSLPTDADRPLPTDGKARFPFDLFAALRFWLADEGNANAKADTELDGHGRLIATHSVQHRKGLRETPVVNAYLLLLCDWLQTCLGIRTRSPLPEGKRCVVALTHDVDDPLDPTCRKEWWLALQHLPRRPQRAAKLFAKGIASGLLGTLRGGIGTGGRERHWLFREVMDAEQKLGFRSSFYFSTVPQFAPEANSLDVRYDLRRQPFCQVFREMAKEGWEIGLHISYDARKGHQRIAREKRTLEEIAGVEVLGSRHHYWHMTQPFWSTLSDHARAGLRYDSSIAFNDLPGYRLGVAFPTRLWNPERGQQINTLQIPCLIMDGAFFCHPNQTVDAVLKHAETLLQELKHYQGVAAIDWHARTSYPGSSTYRLWGEAYLEFIRMLAADSEVLACSGAEALEMCAPCRVAKGAGQKLSHQRGLLI